MRKTLASNKKKSANWKWNHRQIANEMLIKTNGSTFIVFLFRVVVTHSTIQSIRWNCKDVKQIRISLGMATIVNKLQIHYLGINSRVCRTTRHLIKHSVNGNACNLLDPSCAILFRFQSQIENQMLAHYSQKYSRLFAVITVSIPVRRISFDTVNVCALSSEIGITLEKSKYSSHSEQLA